MMLDFIRYPLTENLKFLRRSIVGFLLFLPACITQPQSYSTVAKVDIERFMGDWYVQGHTPVFFDEDSTNQMESYRLDEEGGIDTHYTFNKDGKRHSYNPYGRIYNQETKAHWKMQFLWPFSSDYLIVRLADDYSTTVISVPDKDKIWIMSRSREMQDKTYEDIVEDLKADSYSVKKLRRVPQN